MRITLIGQGPFGAKVLEELAKQGDQVVAAYTVPDPGRAQPVKEAAQKLGVPLFQPARMREPGVYEQYCGLKPELGVMAFVTDIVPLNILNCPKLGSIQYHPSLLPRHRGASAINWALIQGDARTGLTIFWVDQGIDTGPILLQKEVEVQPEDTVGSIYFNKLFPLGVEAMIEAVKLVEAGKAPRIPQDNSQATYEPPCEEKHGLIDWGQPVAQVYNLIRGTNPQPGATTYYRGKKVKLFDAVKLSEAVKGAPGAVVAVTDQGFAVAAQGGAILVKRVQPEGSGKIAATEFVKSSGLQVGDKLGR